MLRYQVIDSHRGMSPAKKEALGNFFCEVKNLTLEEADEQADFCVWFEREFAVKWFEIIVFEGANVVGYLRCLRHPENPVMWLIGDVHVLSSHRGKNIASRMYEKTIKTLKEYEAAEMVLASVHADNEKSIGLHKKMGFFDTKEACVFPRFYFDENETAYKRWLYQYFPVADVKMALDQLLPLWIAYEKEEYKKEKYKKEEYKKEKYKKEEYKKEEYKKAQLDVNKQGLEEHENKHQIQPSGFDEKVSKERFLRILAESVEHEEYVFEAIWCGNRVVGFSYYNDWTDVEYNSQEK